MKKEVILSIVIGFIIGLVATFGVYMARRTLGAAYQIISPLPSDYNDNQTNSVISSQNQIINLSSPIDQSISKEAKTTISGNTNPSAWIVILTEKGEKVIQADDKGNFETEINLISGENEIEVSSLSSNGDKTTQIVTVVYTTAEI